MADQLSLRGGTTTEHATFTGANKEVTVDTTKKTLVVNDGATVGGHPLMRENGSNSALALASAATPSLKFTGDPNTGIYSPGADQVAISTNGTQRLVVDSNGKLSVTSATAAVALITGPANAYIDFTDGTGIFRTQLSSNTPVIGAASNHGLIFTTNSTERLRINPAGLVGIGTSSPAELLHVEGASSPTIRIRNSTTGSTASPASTFLSFNGFNQEGRVSFEAQDRRSSVNGGFLNIATANSSNVLTNALHIDNAQRVGIGTTSPGTILDVVGSGNPTVTVRGSDGTYSGIINIQSAGAGSSIINATGGANALALYTNTTERLRITSAGLVGIGTSAPSSKLEIGNGAVTAGVANGSAGDVLIGRYGSNFGPFFKLSTNNTDGNNGGVSIFTATSASLTEKVRIDSIGRLLVGTSSSSASGDAVIQANLTQVIGKSATAVANNGTTTTTLTTGGGAYQGFLIVSVCSSSNATVSTSATYSIFGRGTTSTITQIATANGAGGARSFTVTTPTSGIVTVTNTAGSNSEIFVSYFGGLGD